MEHATEIDAVVSSFWTPVVVTVEIVVVSPEPNMAGVVGHGLLAS